jgi:hypothetical protein
MLLKSVPELRTAILLLLSVPLPVTSTHTVIETAGIYPTQDSKVDCGTASACFAVKNETQYAQTLKLTTAVTSSPLNHHGCFHTVRRLRHHYISCCQIATAAKWYRNDRHRTVYRSGSFVETLVPCTPMRRVPKFATSRLRVLEMQESTHELLRCEKKTIRRFYAR